jgi:Tol biopolymer transport system component
VTSRQVTLQRPELVFWIHPLVLTADDQHSMRLDAKHVPNPTLNDRLSSTFRLPVGVDIAYCQILENEKILLVLVDQENVCIYLDRFPAMDTAVRGRPIKLLKREKLGRDVLFAFDETKRVLVVCASVKLQLHVFVFDETFKTLQGQGSAINLAPWYGQPGTSIIHTAFVCGNEEVVLIDSSAQARIFSFITLQFRCDLRRVRTWSNY